MIKGSPKDVANLNSVMEIGEGILHSVDKLGRIATSVSDKEEMEIGDKIHQEVVKRHMGLDAKDITLDKYINDVGNKVAENVKRKDIKYKFHVLEIFYPNAFSAPGGHVYITVGLLAMLKSESELAAILAHEITHVDAKHCIGAFQYKIKTEKIVGSALEAIADIGYNLLLRPGFTEVQETEADRGGVYLLYKAGYHPMAAVHAFNRIDKDSSSKGYYNTSATPVGDTLKATAGMFGRYFNTHPMTLERIDKMKKYISDSRMIDENSRFYIGQRNYKENISYKEKRYKEEFHKDYVIVEEKKEEPKKEATKIFRMIVDRSKDNRNKDVLLDEVYTGYGKIASGMTVSEVEIKLSVASQAFKRGDRIGYKKVVVYDFENKGKSEEVGLWIELDKGKVKWIKILR